MQQNITRDGLLCELHLKKIGNDRKKNHLCSSGVGWRIAVKVTTSRLGLSSLSLGTNTIISNALSLTQTQNISLTNQVSLTPPPTTCPPVGTIGTCM